MEAVQFHTPPRTIMQVFKMLPEGTLAELINGQLFMSPSPTPKHQRIIRRLCASMSDFIERYNLGEVFIAPCDVFLDQEQNAVQPDIIFVATANSKIVNEDENIQGVPNLLIEVLSDSNSRHDRTVKKALYEKFGVQEYWIINPDTKEALGYTLKAGVYSEIGSFVAKIPSPLLKNDFAF